MIKYICLLVYSVAILAPLSAPVLAQGSGGYCLRLDEKEVCRFATMDDCNRVARQQGGYCAENFRLYTSGGRKRYCLATRFGTRCDYNSRDGCVVAAGARGMEGAACVDNYALTAKEKKALDELGVPDCAEGDLACQSGF